MYSSVAAFCCCTCARFLSAIPSWLAMRYTSTPRYGKRITKTIHAAFVNPDASFRRKMSTNTVMRIQIQMMNRKKMNIVQRMSRNG